jgi:tRNA U34 5-methylaminomethyl-2-thiouridine-forming methyltransferase MnmC
MNPTKNPKIEVKISDDGSTTFYRPDIDEHYHSIHGAIQESMHIFINAGLNHHQGKALRILEVGFGTGLNALLTMLEAPDKKIVYHALERFPLPPGMVSKVNYPQRLDNPDAQTFFDLMHQAKWDTPCAITPHFELLKMEQDLLTYLPDSLFDLIYFDAFGPDKQPELWSPPVFEKLGKATQPGGILTTYSVKGTVKRALKDAGFAIEKIPGPPGKREMIRATKI